MATMASGHKGVYTRADGKGKRVKYRVPTYMKLIQDGHGNRMWIAVSRHQKQLPIHERYGPAVGELASSTSVQGKLNKLISDKYVEVFARNLKFYMGK